MSQRSLVVQQGALESVESALRDASTNIADFMTQLTDVVGSQTAGWTEGTGSRIAQRAREQELREGVEALRVALGKIADEVDGHREKCHDTELENVAIVG